jgi:hypothetical protein
MCGWLAADHGGWIVAAGLIAIIGGRALLRSCRPLALPCWSA